MRRALNSPFLFLLILSLSNNFAFFLSLYLFFSHIQYTRTTGCPSFTLPSPPNPHFLFSSFPLLLHFPCKKKKKNAGFLGIPTKHDIRVCKKCRHKPSYRDWRRQTNRRERVSKAGRNIRDTFPHTVKNHTRTPSYTTKACMQRT